MYQYDFKKKFLKDLKIISKGDPNRIKHISSMINLIVYDPFSLSLDKKRLHNYKTPVYRYYLGMDYRLLIEIEFDNNFIWFLRIGKRENFY